MKNLLGSRVSRCLIIWLIIFAVFNPLIYAQLPRQEGMEQEQEEMDGFVQSTVARSGEFFASFGGNVAGLIEAIRSFFSNLAINLPDFSENAKNHAKNYAKNPLHGFFEWQKAFMEQSLGSIKFE